MFDRKENAKKKQIMRLWKTIFGDSDKFIRLYFDRVYRDENALVIEEGGQIVSALQMIPYTMTFWGKEISVAYISGACTAPSARGKGLMTRLLNDAFDEMHRRNIALTALIPAEKWLFDYYRRQGYTEAFEFSLKVFTRHDYIEPARDLTVAPAKRASEDELFSYFDRKLRERPACILHTADDFLTIRKDMGMANGQCFIAIDEDKRIVGMAFAVPPRNLSAPDNIAIREILYDNERVKRDLLHEITKRYNTVKAIYRTPLMDNHITYPYGMARVMNRERLIPIWKAAHPESDESIEKMMEMDVRTLTAQLLDYPSRTAYMSLMLD